MRVFLVKKGSELPDWLRSAATATGADAPLSLQRLQALNPHLDFSQLAPGSVVLVPGDGNALGAAAVVLNTPLAIVSANRVRNNADIAIRVDTAKTEAAVANITTGIIQVAGGPLPAPFDPLNLRG